MSALTRVLFISHATCIDFNCSREADLSRKLEHTQIKLSHAVQELESTKEAQRIVLETKESVMRSLLKQNSQIQQEVLLVKLYL